MEFWATFTCTFLYYSIFHKAAATECEPYVYNRSEKGSLRSCENDGLWVSQTFCHLPAVTMGKLLNLFDLSFDLLQNRGENSTYPAGLSCGLNEIVHIKRLVQFQPTLS